MFILKVDDFPSLFLLLVEASLSISCLVYMEIAELAEIFFLLLFILGLSVAVR